LDKYLNPIPTIRGADQAAKTAGSCNKARLRGVIGSIGNNFIRLCSDPALVIHQAMISAIIILALLSLLVATDPEPAGTTTPPAPVPPLRPGEKKLPEGPAKSDRLAA